MQSRIYSLLTALFIALLALASHASADGPQDNHPDKVRRVPRLGIELTEQQSEPLLKRAAQLDARLNKLKGSGKGPAADHWPDVAVMTRSVREAIRYREFFDKRDLNIAKQVLDEAEQRIEQLEQGAAPWTRSGGLVVRGFVSKLDDTVQPVGLVIPRRYSPTGPRRRLDIWFHGRGESTSEMRFIHQRMRNAGVFQPTDGIVLHPYGRYSNAFKFAGEVDTLEALDFARANYPIDPDQISVRGFSMGGAACWQFAVHYADRWFAANPGAGFSETPEFLRFFQKETLNPRWWERDMWHWYDCTDWSANLLHCPTVAYSGELDIQKQAADIMAESLSGHGMKLTHIVGPKTKHRYHPNSRDEVERRMTSIARMGRETPRSLRLTTYTLKYNKMHWIRVDGLGQHWQRAEVTGEIRDDNWIRIRTRNVTDLTIDTPSGWRALAASAPVKLQIDSTRLDTVPPETDRSFRMQFHRVNGKWNPGPRPTAGLRKRHNLQGPIDDAFMDSFLFVKPSGKATHPTVGEWTDRELVRAQEHWRRHFRGHARIKTDSQVTDEDIAKHNLVLWGDPGSNQVLARLRDQLPIAWGTEQITAGGETFASKDHALLMIYPNPLNPNRYVVLNSSFTYRDYAYLNNARQTAKLPDWAVVKVSGQEDPDWPTSRWPGRIVGANFFDEQWRLRDAKPVDHPANPFQ